MTDYDDMRLKAAADAGLPAGLAPRLQGNTADELAGDAQALAAAMPRQPEDHNDLIRRLLAESRGKNNWLAERLFRTPQGDD